MVHVNDSSNRLPLVRKAIKQRGVVVILGSILIGLLLARFTMVSPFAAIIFLSTGIVVVITVFLRKTEYLIYTWFVLTSLLWLIIVQLVPLSYHAYIGRGIFWGGLICIIVAWAIDNILRGRQFMPFDYVLLKAVILIFLLWCITTLFTSIDVFNSVKKLSHIVIAFIASYMFYDFFSQGEDNIKKTLKIVSLVVVFVSLITVGLAIRGLISGVPIYKEIQLWFLNPNVLGSFIFICSPLLITSGFDFRVMRRLKVFFVGLMLLALYAVNRSLLSVVILRYGTGRTRH